MSGVKKFKVRSKLSMVALGNGGITAYEAMKRADSGVDQLRPPSLEMVDYCLATMERRFGRKAPDRDAEPLEDLYSLASQMIDNSIGLPGAGIEHAARSLCDLIDLSIEKEMVAWDVVEVHFETLKLLRATGQAFSEPQREAILAGLKKATAKRIGEVDDTLSA